MESDIWEKSTSIKLNFINFSIILASRIDSLKISYEYINIICHISNESYLNVLF